MPLTFILIYKSIPSGLVFECFADHFWYYLGKFAINLQKKENDLPIGRKTTRWVDFRLLYQT